jgi:hypothetical protein
VRVFWCVGGFFLSPFRARSHCGFSNENKTLTTKSQTHDTVYIPARPGCAALISILLLYYTDADKYIISYSWRASCAVAYIVCSVTRYCYPSRCAVIERASHTFYRFYFWNLRRTFRGNKKNHLSSRDVYPYLWETLNKARASQRLYYYTYCIVHNIEYCLSLKYCFRSKYKKLMNKIIQTPTRQHLHRRTSYLF